MGGVYIAVSISLITVIFSQLLLFIALNVLLADRFTDAALDAAKKVSSDLLALDILVENEHEFDFLRQFIQLELPVVTEVG